MTKTSIMNAKISRRRALQTSLAAGAGIAAAPAAFAQSANPIKIGLVDSTTGNFAILGKVSIKGAQMAAAEINAKGGVLGRPLQTFVEDDAGSPAAGLSKAASLLSEQNVDFFAGTSNSAVALAVSQFAKAHSKVFMTNGHVDSLTGKACNWATFRVCATNWILTKGNSKTLYDKLGKKWFFLTTDYAFGRSEQADYTKQLTGYGGGVVGSALAPIGTADFSTFLSQVKTAAPDVLVLLLIGDDQTNAMRQISDMGLDKTMAVGGALFDLEGLAALPPQARFGEWTFEWYWNQPDVPHVADFVQRYKTLYNGEYPTARSWFGFVAIHSLALACEKAGTTESIKVAKALEGMELPPEIALQPGKVSYRAEDHQLLLGMFPGSADPKGTYPNLLNISGYVPGETLALTPAETGCKMVYPA